MAKYIVHARIDERGKISGGSAGDQARELVVQTLSSSGSWAYILRPPKNADTMIRQAYAAAANDNIGYDQLQRTTLYSKAKATNWDLSKVGKCECDCSSLIAVLANCAGFKVSKDMYTGNEVSCLVNVGFKKMAYKESNLKAGDVLLRNGHTAIYVGTSSKYTSTPNTTIKNANTGGNTVNISLPIIKKGSKGNTVKAVQGILDSLGYDLGSYGCDGSFGAATEKAVKAFQKKKGLSQDGVVGEKTYKALLC